MARPAPTTPMGRRTFHFKRRLGTGSFGEVYEATLASPGGLRRRVAVKLLKPEVADDLDAIERLRDEGMLLSNLDHPNILSVIDLVRIGEQRALVTEYVDGEDLLDLLRRPEERMPLRSVLHTGAQVARALDAAWSSILESGEPMRLIHRDIKPGNIRVSRHGVVKLLDFGIARSDQLDRRARTETEVVVGSVPYMAPETFQLLEPTDKLDVFALGCVLYEGLTGERLYNGLKRNRTLQLLAVEEAFSPFVSERIAHLGSLVPADVAGTVGLCLRWAAEDRPSAAGLADGLERIAALTPGPTLPEWCRERRWAEPETGLGALGGMAITEGTLTVASRVGELQESDTTPTRAVAVIAVVLGVVCAGLVGGGAAMEWGLLTKTPVPEPQPVVQPADPPKPGPGPEPTLVQPPTPTPAPTPVVKPTPNPAPDPSPTAPTPDTDPELPPDPAAEPALLQVYFQNKDGEKFGPDQALPPGPYRIIADFGDGLARVGSAEVAPGQEIELVCNPTTKTCSLR